MDMDFNRQTSGNLSPKPLPPRKTKVTLTAVKMPDTVTKCQHCQAARDEVVCYCNQCDLDLCLRCDGRIHGREGDSASHVRTYFKRVVYGDRPENEIPKEALPKTVKEGETEYKIEREAHVNLRRQQQELLRQQQAAALAAQQAQSAHTPPSPKGGDVLLSGGGGGKEGSSSGKEGSSSGKEGSSGGGKEGEKHNSNNNSPLRRSPSPSTRGVVGEGGGGGGARPQGPAAVQASEAIKAGQAAQRTLSNYRDDPRFKAVFDVYMTEREYCDNLHKLLENFIKPLTNATAAFSEAGVGAKRIETLFDEFLSNVEPMFHLNSLLCRAMHERLKDWDSDKTCVADLFLDNAPLFEFYRIYAKEHLPAQATLDREYSGLVKQLEDQARVKELDREAKKQRQRDHQDSVTWRPSTIEEMSLAQLLTLPVTRMSKYVLFLEFLLRATKDTHDDFVGVTRALNVIKATQDDVSQRVAEARNLLQLEQLKQLFINQQKLVNFVKPHRYLVLEKTLLRSTRHGFKEYHFHLFNDMMLYSTPTGKNFKVHREIDLIKTIVTDRPSSDKEPYELQINNMEKSFLMQFNDEHEKEKWHKALDGCIARLLKGKDDEGEKKHVTKLAPIWTEDSVSEVCLICKNTKFNLINRRHHCRNCGVLACGSCSTERRLLKNIDRKKPVRVCHQCAEKLP